MARYDVYNSPSGRGFVLSVQSDLLGGLNTVVVVPLMAPDQAPRPAVGLNPKLSVMGVPVFMVTQFMAAVPTRELGAPVWNLAQSREAIDTAVDLLHQGW